MRENIYNRMAISINSIAYFIISYLVVFFLSQFITIITTLSCNIPVQLFFHKIEFLVRSTSWTSDSVKIIFSAGPISALVLGFIFLIIYTKVIDTDGLLKLFFLWGFIHGFTIFFGSILIGTFINQGFGYVINWLYFFDTAKLLIVAFSAIVMLLIGLTVPKYFFTSANTYYNNQHPKQRKSFLMNQILIPWLIGGVLINLFKISNNQGIYQFRIYDIMLFSSSLLIILPSFFQTYKYPELYFDEEPKSFFISWKSVVISIVLLLVLKIGLYRGIRLG